MSNDVQSDMPLVGALSPRALRRANPRYIGATPTGSVGKHLYRPIWGVRSLDLHDDAFFANRVHNPPDEPELRCLTLSTRSLTAARRRKQGP
jgi:hypothetical protein